jgi:uncharacterized damage-inducible protein DinB
MSPALNDLPEPSGDTADPRVLLDRYLAWYRSTAVRKVRSLPAGEGRRTRLPSGWTPLELLAHLAHMERRWLVWGFLGERVDDPWGDERQGRWHVPSDVSTDDVVAMLEQVGRRTREVLAGHRLDELAPPGPRFPHGDPATLGWICFHVLQEYARHTGHLDVAVELAGGELGE